MGVLVVCNVEVTFIRRGVDEMDGRVADMQA